MVQSPWETNWFAASQEIPRISRNPKVHYHTHKSPPPVSILGQPNPVHIPTSHLLEIHPNIIHPSTPMSPQCAMSLIWQMSCIISVQKKEEIFPRHSVPVYTLVLVHRLNVDVQSGQKLVDRQQSITQRCAPCGCNLRYTLWVSLSVWVSEQRDCYIWRWHKISETSQIRNYFWRRVHFWFRRCADGSTVTETRGTRY